MSQQVKSPPKFCIEKAFQKGPLHLLYNHRLGQLQNKINFFQGQVDPLLEENINLKEQLIELSKLVESSTDILRNLLPTYDNPNKKLKLEMATIEEIAKMIKDDWHRMEGKLAENAKSIKKLREERDHWKDLFEEEKNERIRQVFQLQELCKQNRISYESQITSLQKSLQSLEAVHIEQKKQMQVEFSERVKVYKLIERQFEKYKRQVKNKEEQYEKKIARLNGQIDANLLSFQETKKNIKAIYDKLMTDKLSEQAQGFQMLLKMKEQEKMQILISMGEAEDEYKRRAAQKQYEITKLTQRNDSYRQEVGQLKDDIWKKQLQLDKQFQEGRAREEAIAKLQTQKKNLIKQIEENEQEYTQQKANLERIIASRNEEIQLLREEGNASVQKAIAQKAALEKELQQKQQKLRQTLLNLRKKDDVWQKQIQKLQEQWKKQEEAIKQQLQEQQKTNRLWSYKLQESEKQREEMAKDQAQKLRRIEEVHREQQYILQSRYQAKISEITEKQQLQLSQIRTRHQRQLTEANINANESLRQVMANCNRRMTEQEANFLLERHQLQNQIKDKQEQVKRAEKKYIQASNTIQKMENKHRQEIKQLNAAAQQEKQRLENEMLNQMRNFQQQMEKQEARLTSIKQQMMKQIAMLKEANAIQTIQSRFLNEINKLKEQFAERIKKNEQEYKNNEEALEQAHKNKISQLKEGFHQDLINIAEKIEQKSTYLNQRLITGFVDSQVLGMNEEQKKEYIIRKVTEIKKNNAEKEKKISELQFGLDQAEKNIEKRVKARKEELERQKDILEKQCSQKIESITNECRTKVAEVEKDRIQHSQAMYIEFQSLREHHQGILNALNKKYNQLEKLFEQRPSRMEDLSKIKELTNMQMKLDIEIQSYQKKMETANEIVKYLNLQLQNYKDSYDIFGPNGESIVGGIVGQSVIKGNNNSNTAPSESQHILDVIKSHRHHSQAKIFNEKRKEVPQEPLAFRKWNETAAPAVKQLKIFQDDQSEHSAVQSRDFSEPKEDKKYSYLIVDKGSAERKNRFKTQKSEKLQHESEILINAENFIKLIKGNQEETPPPVIRQIDSDRRKSYRKRKLLKRQPTQGFDHYF